MNTIQTKFLSPTTTKGARIKATTESGISKTISFPYELDGFECHALAVKELNKKLAWKGDMVACSINNGDGFVFVFSEDNKITL